MPRKSRLTPQQKRWRDQLTPEQLEPMKHWVELMETRFGRSNRFNKNLVHETDGGCALVAGAFLDQRLLELLQARMIDRATKDKFDFFFRGFGPLATFAARTHFAYLLGLIGTKIYQDLGRIRDIRNRFAHASEQIDFNDKEIKQWCTNLHHYVGTMDDHPRGQFVGAVITVEMKLDFLIVNSEYATTPPDGPENADEEMPLRYDLYQAKLGIPPELRARPEDLQQQD